jgi:hypothetical protein
LEGTVKRVAVLGLIGFVAVPGVADAATTCRGNTLTAVGSTIVTVSYRATGVTFRDVHQDAETPCGTLTDPWTIHYRGGSATGGDLVTVAMYDAAPRIDLAPAGPGTLLHVDASDPGGVEVHITGDALTIASRTTPELAGTVTATNEVWVVDGSPGPDVIYGGDEAENLNGGTAGDDLIDGGGGDDTIGGGDGADTLIGGTGPTSIFGGRGRDTIIGGPGFDSLHGDYGKDFIDAADGGVDEVRGGRNYDRAIIDPNDDVKNIQKVEA